MPRSLHNRELNGLRPVPASLGLGPTLDMSAGPTIGSPGANRGLLANSLHVLLLYLGLTLLMTFPLVLSFRNALPAGSGDLWQNYWNFWWWKQCLLEAQNPLHAPVLFHPFGTDLVFHTHSPFNQIVAMPVNLLFGEAAAYNFCLFLALTLSGFGAYLLVRELTRSASAGFLAGLVFAYFPQTVEQTLEHLNLFSVQFIPLSLFFLLRWSRSLRTVHALAFGICFGLNSLCSWHLGLKLALVVLPWILWVAWKTRERWRIYLRGVLAAAAVSALLALPVLAPMLVLIADGIDYYVKSPVLRGIDPTYLLTPTYANPLLGSWVQPKYVHRAYQASGFICYLGFVPLALAAVGVWRGPRRTYGWLALFVIALVLALGAQPLWNGSLLDSVTLPFAWFRNVLFLENLRVANRFLLLAGLGLAVLAGYGWKTLRNKPSWALPLTAALLLSEYSWLPYPVQSVEFSPLFQRITDRPGGVLDIPFHQRSRTVHNMVAQTIHGRPISGGYLSSYPSRTLEAVEREPALRRLAGVPEPGARVDIENLRQLGFSTVVVHKYRMESVRAAKLRAVGPGRLLERKRVLRLGGVPDEAVAAVRKQLDETLGGAVFEDEQLAVYFL